MGKRLTCDRCGKPTNPLHLVVRYPKPRTQETERVCGACFAKAIRS